MTQARRAVQRHPWESVRDTIRHRSGPFGGRVHRGTSVPRPERALLDPDEQPGSGSRMRLLVPGVAATVVVVGTAGVVVGANRGSGLDAVPAAVPQDISMREMGNVSRSEQRLWPEASQTPSASAMASATPSATASAASASPKASATSSAKVTPKATASTKASTSAASGSVANCPKPSGWLGANAQKVYQASCVAFPYVTAYGGSRAGDSGPHGTGHAVDIMITGSRGSEIAAYMRSHAAELGITEVIYQQKIWTTQRSSEGWRAMEDRGSATANHMDHVHVTVS
ncbi:hypothetical protein [Raineyella sp. W15-4]|uniref:hypothetical protein n=1 Tax=Raineyella sp. W15-4 TaxID=3081651 RepID=UPI002952F4B9|nr:hypothetical protein [Raineyella sp. W15-4]WOQ16738.1 hypothetical protein R0145_16255 [Raineyella sp. W15-4]